jgi:hypothetical protein
MVMLARFAVPPSRYSTSYITGAAVALGVGVGGLEVGVRFDVRGPGDVQRDRYATTKQTSTISMR